MDKLYPALSAFWAMIGVILGAIGSHLLSKVFDAHQMDSWSTASDYHMFHAIAGVALLGLEGKMPVKLLNQATKFLFLGSLFFSGSIYIVTLVNDPESIWHNLVHITPVGGVGMIAGWATLGYGLFKE